MLSEAKHLTIESNPLPIYILIRLHLTFHMPCSCREMGIQFIIINWVTRSGIPIFLSGVVITALLFFNPKSPCFWDPDRFLVGTRSAIYFPFSTQIFAMFTTVSTAFSMPHTETHSFRLW